MKHLIYEVIGGKNMCLLIFIILNAIHGGILTSASVTIDSWQYWLTTLCVCGAYICGCIETKKR